MSLTNRISHLFNGLGLVAAVASVAATSHAQDKDFFLIPFLYQCMEFPDANGDWVEDCGFRYSDAGTFMVRRAYEYDVERTNGTLKFEPAKPYQSVWDFTG